MRRYSSILILFAAFLFVGLNSCKKDLPFTKNHLDFSTDSLLFDTVFTTIGSTTKTFKIYNRNSQPINIDAIQLMGGESSPYRINVDGIPADDFVNIEIPANDSLFVFVEVTLNVNGGTLPLVVSDSIRFRTNGLDQYVYLDTWGQDAYFHVNEVVSGTWPTDKPHVLYGTVAVGFPGIDSNLNLTIPAGAQVYCHKDAQMIVYKSSLDILGTIGNEVTFQGDRLESFYDDVSGQWWGIRMIEAQESTFNYAVIKNASVALQVDSTMDATTLNLNNTIIRNNDFFSLNVNAGSVINATNCIFGDAGIAGTYLFAGGEYHFDHCNFVNWSNGNSPAFVMANWWEADGTTYARDITNSFFRNCVAYGNIANEWVVDTLDPGGLTMFFEVQNCLLANEEPVDAPGSYINCNWNENPEFIDPTTGMWDYHFAASSPLNGGGTDLGILLDIEGVMRSSPPDIGALEGP